LGKDQDLTIKRVTLASGGEIAKYCPSILQGRIEKIIQNYMDNLFIISEEHDAGGLIEACCNNSAWAIGELALAYPSEFTNYIPQFVNRICELFNNENLKVSFFNEGKEFSALKRILIFSYFSSFISLDKLPT